MKSQLTIKDIMTANPCTVNIDARISDIIKLLEDNRFDHLPILDDQNMLAGIISKTDLYKKALSLSKSTSGKAYSEKLLYVSRAKEIMTPDPIFITSDQSVDYATELLLQDEFHALPVLENDKLIGIITSKDILESMVNYNVDES